MNGAVLQLWGHRGDEWCRPTAVGSFAGPSEPSDGKQGDGDGAPPSKKGRKRKSVSWAEEGRLREYFYFELDETERGEWGGPYGDGGEKEPKGSLKGWGDPKRMGDPKRSLKGA